MRNYTDQDDAATQGVNKSSLLTGQSLVPQPELPSDKALHEKKSAPKPKAKRVAHATPSPEKPPPVSRNSIELIEGSKRRDVDIP